MNTLKDFIVKILSGFFDAFSVMGGAAYDGNIVDTILGFLIIPCFLMGIFEIFRIMNKIIYDYRSRKKWGKK